jgi:hypothetical protein
MRTLSAKKLEMKDIKEFPTSPSYFKYFIENICWWQTEKPVV